MALVGPGEQEPTYRTAGAPGSSAYEYDLGSIILAYRAKLDESDRRVVTPINLTQV